MPYHHDHSQSQFAATKCVDCPSYCMPYGAVSPITWTYNITYGPGSVVKYINTLGASNAVPYKGINYSYPRGSDRCGVLLWDLSVTPDDDIRGFSPE